MTNGSAAKEFIERVIDTVPEDELIEALSLFLEEHSIVDDFVAWMNDWKRQMGIE